MQTLLFQYICLLEYRVDINIGEKAITGVSLKSGTIHKIVFQTKKVMKNFFLILYA